MYHKTIPLFGNSYFAGLNSDVIDLYDHLGFSAQFVFDDTTPVAAEFAAAVTDICTIATHGYTTGLKVQVSTTDALPAPLLAATDYFVVVLGPNTFKLSDTYDHAIAGTNLINIADTGTGTHTMTPVVLAGGVIKLQSSNDNQNWGDIASQTANITADGNVMFNVSGVYYKFIRAVLALTAGRLSISGTVVLK